MQRTIKILKSTSAYLIHWKRVFEDQLHKDKLSGPDCSKVGQSTSHWLSVTKTIPGRYPGSYSSSG